MNVRLSAFILFFEGSPSDAEQRMRVGEEGRIWSEKVLNMSGLLAVN